MIVGIVSAVVLLGQGEPNAAARQFDALGFETRVVGPNGLTISGDRAIFVKNFGIAIVTAEDGFWVAGDGGRSRVIPQAKLPAALRAQVKAIEFEAPPDFGPSNF